MTEKKIEVLMEAVEAGSDVAKLVGDIGAPPGTKLIIKLIQLHHEKYVQKRFEQFIVEAEIDEILISKISNNETYSNSFYAILEAIRQTHSKIGVVALALIYKNYWDDEDFLIAAVSAFSQVSDKTLNAFITLYEAIQPEKDHLNLTTNKDGENQFHDLYNEAVELINRNFFVMSTGASMYANGPIQGMKWTHTDSYYLYCVKAKTRV